MPKGLPRREHLYRALRHINMALMDDASDNHIINASMRLMMADVVGRFEKKIWKVDDKLYLCNHKRRSSFGRYTVLSFAINIYRAALKHRRSGKQK